MDFKYARQEKWNEQDKFKMFYLSFSLTLKEELAALRIADMTRMAGVTSHCKNIRRQGLWYSHTTEITLATEMIIGR